MASYHVYNGLKVETNLDGEVTDHRDGFCQEQYRKGMSGTFQSVPEGPTPKGPNTMATRPVTPKRKASKKPSSKTDDKALQEANKKDLKRKNIN
jgi:hypothetical protein